MGSSVESSRVAAYPVPPHGRALIALGIFVVTLGAFAAPAAAQYARRIARVRPDDDGCECIYDEVGIFEST